MSRRWSYLERAAKGWSWLTATKSATICPARWRSSTLVSWDRHRSRSMAGRRIDAVDQHALGLLDARWSLGDASDRLGQRLLTLVPLARDHNVKVAIKMHPQNLVFNPATLKRLMDKVGATHVGAEIDPSHLFWQGIDPVTAIEWLGPLVFHAAAKHTRDQRQLQELRRARRAVHRIPLDHKPTRLRGRHVVNKWPEDSA